MKIKFLGAAGMVTGSNHLIEANDKKILLDCGMFQGGDIEEQLNYEDFKFNPAEIDYVVLSHAHIDHSGRIPKLVKEGFKGRIIATKATTELSEIMLLDSAYIQEKDTEWANRKRERRGEEMLEPLYGNEDVERAMYYFEEYYYDQIIELDENIKLVFRDAGHMLGSAVVELWINEKGETSKIVYSGDLGAKSRAIINNPTYVNGCDYLIIESTYGDTVHEKVEENVEKLISIIDETTKRGGTLIIPAFSVGRTQEIIYELNRYYEKESLENYLKVPIYVDSPLAMRATRVYEKNADLFNTETTDLILSGDNPFQFPNLRYVDSVEESKMLNRTAFPKVVIASSGMADAGRVRHHLKHNLWNKKSCVLFVGYQAVGSTGRRLLDGVETLKIAGEEVQVNAEIKKLDGFSAHADQKIIIDWIDKMTDKPKKIFLVHGEDEAQNTLKSLIDAKFETECVIPKMYDEVEITRDYETVKLSHFDNIELMNRDLRNIIGSVDEKYNALIENLEKIEDDAHLKKNYQDYKDKLLEIQNRIMEMIVIGGK
ncbi:MAG: MBL fold metallo-hydrolase [Tissierellia bacterium]|nr:MBL fold metallo-hydrolase [Tissierellia bacterium]